MHIILVSERMATARTITLTLRHAIAAVAVLVALVLLASGLFSVITLQHIERVPLPFVQDILSGLRQQEAQKTQEVVRENLTAMAVKLGEMQARMVRLDTLGERLAKLTGIKLPEFEAAGKDGRGGPLVTTIDFGSAQDLERELAALSDQVEKSGDYLDLVDGRLLDQRVRRSLLPSALPVATGEDGSGFGWRLDPFTGTRAMHEGIDFQADPGTPILAAAGGVVVAAEYHPAYGNLIEIDHGGELVTRYAHASKTLVRVGQVVRRGQTIAEVGSTGRSTGPHLHFEVRSRGVAQNPYRFLKAAGAGRAPELAAK